MKNYIISLFVLSNLMLANAQVGIDTETPSAKLDINGDLKIRDVEPLASIANNPTILVRDEADDNSVKGIKYALLFGTNKSLVYAYQKGGNSLISINATALTIGTINWNFIELNGTANSGGFLSIGSSSVFDGKVYTAPSNGYYLIHLELQFTGLIQSSALGEKKLAVIKTPADNPTNHSVAFSKNFDGVTIKIEPIINLTLANVPLSSTTLETIIHLNEGDRLRFGIENTLLNATILGNTTYKMYTYKLPE